MQDAPAPLSFWAEPIEEPRAQALRNLEAWHAQVGSLFQGHVTVARRGKALETRVVGADVTKSLNQESTQ